MRLRKYAEMNEMVMNPIFINAIRKLKDYSWNQVKKKFQEAWNKIVNFIECSDNDIEISKNALQVINKHMGTNYKDLREISSLRESVELNEDITHWWEVIKSEAFPTLSFYPALQCWLELDKLLKGNGFNGTVIAIYAVFWLLLVSGKYVKGWLDWKKQNKSEYDAERKLGKGGLF